MNNNTGNRLHRRRYTYRSIVFARWRQCAPLPGYFCSRVCELSRLHLDRFPLQGSRNVKTSLHVGISPRVALPAAMRTSNSCAMGERNCADTIGTVLVPSAGHFQCQYINIFFSNKIYESNFIKQHPETVMV